MGSGKKKIEIKKKEKESDRMVTFSKRKQGLFKKASQLQALTGSQVAILLFSPAGRPHTNAPLFDAAISSYFRCLRDRGGAAADGDVSGSKDDDISPVGMWLDSVNLGVGVDEGGDNTDVSAIGGENGGSAGVWLKSHVESLLGDGGGGDCSATGNCRCIREWVNSLNVEVVEKVEDLQEMKQRLENIKENLMNKVDDAFCSSLFV